MAMDTESRRDLEMLEAVAQNDRITQRTLATRLGIALGLANIYLKRLSSKGYIKCVSVRPNRLRYLLTPKGIAEKSRLTYEYMEYSLHFYREARHQLRLVLEPLASNGSHRIAIYGTGDAAELAYLSLREFGIEPVAIFDTTGGARFLGMAVAPIADQGQFTYDLLILATLERAAQGVAELTDLGIAREKMVPLRPIQQRSHGIEAIAMVKR